MPDEVQTNNGEQKMSITKGNKPAPRATRNTDIIRALLMLAGFVTGGAVMVFTISAAFQPASIGGITST